MSKSKQHQFLSKIQFFANLSDEGIEKIASTAIKKVYEQDEYLYFEGDESAGLYIVESGWIKAAKISQNGREQILKLAGPGEEFNALGIFLDVPNPANAIALEKSTVWIVKKNTLQHIIEENPIIAKSIIKTLAGRIQYLISLIEDLSLRSVESRLSRLLLNQATDNIIYRKKWLTQNEIAATLGTVSDVISRTLRKLSAEEIITVTRKEIILLLPEELETRAENQS